jgi:hypothetical protein
LNRYHILKFSYRPFKSYELLKIHLHHLNRNFILWPHVDNGWQAAHQRKRRVADHRSPGNTGLYVFTCLACGGADSRHGRRLSNCNLQMADRTPLKSGLGIPDINQKVEPRTAPQIYLRPRATGKKIFTSIERTFNKS